MLLGPTSLLGLSVYCISSLLMGLKEGVLRFVFKEIKTSLRGSFQSTLVFSAIKGALSGLRQFLATESPLKMMKNAFYSTVKALFVHKTSKFLS